MKHCISIIPGSRYTPLVDLIAQEDEDADARELTNEVDANGQPYQLLSVWTVEEISAETQQAVDSYSNVIVSTFNIEEWS